MKVEKGIKNGPQRVIIYGPEGIGKSTFASYFPNPIFFDLEGGSLRIDVDRVSQKEIPDYSSLIAGLKSVISNREYSTIVIDTIDEAERLSIRNICEQNKVQNIESFGYGKGYVYAYAEWQKFLKLLMCAINRGIYVVLIAHAAMRTFNPPGEVAGYDRWEMKLQDKTNAKVSAMCKEWADIVLFMTYKVATVLKDESSKKSIARGSGSRVIYTQHRPVFDAKSRFPLPFEMPVDDFETFSKIIGLKDWRDNRSVIEKDVKDNVKNTPDETKIADNTVAKSHGNHEENPSDVSVKKETDSILSKFKDEHDKRVMKELGDKIYGMKNPGLMHLYELMCESVITDYDLEHLCSDVKHYMPKGKKVIEYPDDFVKHIVSYWDDVSKSIKNDVPF